MTTLPSLPRPDPPRWASPSRTHPLQPLALLVAAALAAGTACRTGRPLFGADEDPATRATLSGTVRGPEGSAPVVGRQVEAVGVSRHWRYIATTNVEGGFTFLLPPGRYRLKLSLSTAERIVRQPGIIELAPGALVVDADFLLGGAGVVQE